MDEFKDISYALKIMLDNKPLSECEGYSRNDMKRIVHEIFKENSIIRFQKKIDSDILNRINFLLQCEYFLNYVKESEEIKLTNHGYLPPKFVKELYNKNYLDDELIGSGLVKLRKEKDSMIINLTKIIVELSGLTKKRNNRISLTIKGNKLLNDRVELFKTLFETFILKFNWAYYDGYGYHSSIQTGVGFSLILLKKYGNLEKKDYFYVEKFRKTFPKLIEEFDQIYLPILSSEEQLRRCYSLRTFDRFLKYFNLIKLRRETAKNIKVIENIYISTTEIFDKIFIIEE